jgi:hypothetical protein
MAMTLSAEMTVKEYREYMGKPGVQRESMKVYVLGIGEGIAWAKSGQRDSATPLYCAPPKLALGMDNYVDILNRQIEEYSKREPASALESEFIGLLLLNGLRATFPCSTGK